MHAIEANDCDPMLHDLKKADIEKYVESQMYQPRYAPLVYREPGKGE